MSDGINFHDDDLLHYKSTEVFGAPKTPGMTSWLQERGIIKSEKTAMFFLVAVVIFCFGLTGILLTRYFGSNKNVPTPRSSEEVRTIQESFRNQNINRN